MRAGIAVVLLSALVASLPCAAAGAAPSRVQRAQAQDVLSTSVENVRDSTGHRYGARDHEGRSLDGLKVVQAGGRNIGVYHTFEDGAFNVHLATSKDLLNWTREATLDRDAAQATIQALPNGGFLVAYEKAHAARPADRLLGRTENPTDRIRVRFRYYRTLDALLHAQHSRQFTAPRRVSPTAEGTPHFIDVDMPRGLISRSTIKVGLHRFSDLNDNGKPDVDRRSTGELRGFRDWEVREAPDIDAAFLEARQLHAGFTAPPSGHIGDRDQIILDGIRLQLHEAQYAFKDYSTWRPFLIDTRTTALRPLAIATHGGSRSFGNPTVTEITSPAGRRALLVTLFVFTEGAAPGEPGSLVYYRER